MPSFRQRKHAAAALLAVTLWGGVPSFAAVHPHHKKLAHEQIESLEDDWKQALISNDAAAMDNLLADGYLGVTVNGELVTKNQQLDRMKSRDLTITSLDISDRKIKLIGQIAIVNSQARIQGTMEGRPIDGTYRYVRIYERLPTGEWKITSFQTTRIPRNHSPRPD